MAKYEKTRTYVVSQIFGSGNGVVFSAPTGRAYASITLRTWELPKRMVKALKVGKKVTFTRFSTRTSTWFAPKAK
jgi:hypothetical protein